MFDPDDEQNVSAMTTCFSNLAKVADKNFEDYHFTDNDPANSERFELIFEMKIIFAISKCMHYYLTSSGVSISEHLINLSMLSHLLFVVYRASGSAFMCNQNYHNIQSVVKAAFKSVATCIVEGIDEYFVYQDCDDKTENLFRDVRSILSGAANFDVYELEQRLQSATIMGIIYEKYPHLKTVSRRLNGSLDHWNPKSWIGTTEDVDLVDPRKVDLKDCWKLGSQKAAAILTRDRIFTAEEVDFATIAANEPNTTMYKPRGTFVGSRPDLV